MRTRSSGILMHISSLPSDYGIGDFGKQAYKFVDFLEISNQKYWQILPLGVTGFGDSPYQCFSAFAGNPYFIDLDRLIELGYLKEEDVKSLKNNNKEGDIDYGDLYIKKTGLLKTAYNRSKASIFEDLKSFYETNKDWLREFALFMTLKDSKGGGSWMDWEEEYKDINSTWVLEFEKNSQEEIYFWVFTQYFFYKQWKALKDYANEKGIGIIGDLPIYVAMDSSDVWASPGSFNLDENLQPITVAGCPPDDFSDQGQLWGNPIYRWDRMEDEGYSWWIKRMKSSFQLYDVVRIDHFIGFDSYWEVEYGAENARNGSRKKGPGIKLFNKIKEELGDLNIIAEDLGVVTEGVKELIKETDFPGMKILQFAFDHKGESEHIPHLYNKNTVVYTGTHDNSTISAWVEIMGAEDLEYAKEYLKIGQDEGLNWGFIRGAWSSTAYLAIAPIQDFLGLGDEARMNLPSTVGKNWKYRIGKDDLTDELGAKIARLTKIYRR